MLEVDPQVLPTGAGRIPALPLQILQSVLAQSTILSPALVQRPSYRTAKHSALFPCLPYLSPISMVHISRPAKASEQLTIDRGPVRERVTE